MNNIFHPFRFRHAAVLLLILASVSCQKVIYQNDSYTLYNNKVVQGPYTAVAETPYRIVSNYDGDDLVWEKKNDISAFPKLTTPYAVEEAVYNMSVDECINAVEPDGTLRTGLEWGGVWTRDVSYSIILSMAYMQPQAAMTSLLCKISEKGEIIQDTGTGGAWPCSTDRMIWAGAAWEIYKVTGDRTWLETVYPVVKKSLEVDMRTIYDDETGLAKGESSFIDWRKQSYPQWMDSGDISASKCLGTNMVHYIALTSGAQMASLMGDSQAGDKFREKAAEVKAAVNEHLWMEDKGYYAQYLGGRNDDILYKKSETLGQALAILYGVADVCDKECDECPSRCENANGACEGRESSLKACAKCPENCAVTSSKCPENRAVKCSKNHAVACSKCAENRAVRLSESLPVVDFGAPVFWPWIADMAPYHNRAVWPFVQSYWIQACAKNGNEKGVIHGVGAVWRAALMYATNKENFVANDGNWKGTQVNSSNMLWSLSGSLSITFRTLLGINFVCDAAVSDASFGSENEAKTAYENAAILFAPVVPKSLSAERKIEKFPYRNALLDITVKGYGDVIKSFKIDGVEVAEPVFSSDVEGHHSVELVMANRFANDLNINMQGDVRAPLTPFVRFNSRKTSIRWYSEEGAHHYDIYAGGEKVHETARPGCSIQKDWKGDVQVVAVMADGTESFPCEPLSLNKKIAGSFDPVLLLAKRTDAKDRVPAFPAKLKVVSGKDYSIVVEVPYDGEWNLSWNYANARGTLYSERTCGLRMLYVDGVKSGLNIFPNRHWASGSPANLATDGWDIWGWTTPHKIHLTAGRHTLTLKEESDADNMSLKVNDFMLKGYSLTED